MHFSPLFLIPTLLPLLTHAAPLLDSSSSPCYSAISPAYLDTIVSNYLVIWSGPDFTLLNSTISPNITYYQDRLPTGTGNGSVDFPITNTSSFVQFVEISRQGTSEYVFREVKAIASDNQVALRWNLRSVGNGTDAYRNVPVGTVVSYNGTDILTLDRCTGLIATVESAQDFLNYFHQLQVPLGTV